MHIGFLSLRHHPHLLFRSLSTTAPCFLSLAVLCPRRRQPEMTTDEWVTAALTDDAVVVELLFRLKQSSESFASQQPKLQLVVPPLGWGHHQPRSKPAVTAKKERESTRCSPTTPLSWSGDGGGASTSDGCDESSRPSDHSSGGRSKGTFTNDTIATATGTTNKRSRRKKHTFAELKDEESLLQKERIHLMKELEILRVTIEEQNARSENLKRLKLDLHLHSANKMAAASDAQKAVNPHQHNLEEASTLDNVPVSPTITMHDDHPAPDSCKIEKQAETMERCFILPDLNTMPSEEDSGCDTIYGLS